MNHDTPSTPDTVRDTLRRVADGLELSPIAPEVARRRAAVRRKRRVALASVGVLAGVGAVGAVVANQDRGDDTIELSTPPETSAAPGGDDGPSATAPPTTSPVTTPPTLPPADVAASRTGFETADISASAPATFAQLLPWRDGFLRIGVDYPAQPLPALPEEITALFPDEVIALFPDGLPPTIDEATAALSEAGLLDEVTAVLAEHPEASDAIYSAEPLPATVRADFTIDGTEWRTVELDAPTTYPGQFAVSGDRLITWSVEWDAPVDPTASAPTGSTFVLAWTDDLTSWQRTEIELGSPVPGPAHIRSDRSVSNVVFAGDRWVAQITEHQWIEYTSLLPDDLVAELEQVGYGISHDRDGITIDRSDEAGAGETVRFTWAELGLDGDPAPTIDQEPTSSFLTATFGGEPVETDAPDDAGWGGLHSDGTTFFFTSGSLRESADGISWSEPTELPVDNVTAVVPVDGGALFVGDGPNGPSAAVRAADGTFRAATLPELPNRYGLWNTSGSAAWVVELYDGEQIDEEPTWEPVTVTVEHDGVTVTLTDGPDGTAYTLIDAADGTVIREGVVGPDGEDREQIVEYDEVTGTYDMVVRDEAGNEIVRVPGDVLDTAWDTAYEAADGDTAVTVVPGEAPEVWAPDLWLLATANGFDWLTIDIEDATSDGSRWPQAAAVNGNNVLYQTPNGEMLAALPAG